MLTRYNSVVIIQVLLFTIGVSYAGHVSDLLTNNAKNIHEEHSDNCKMLGALKLEEIDLMKQNNKYEIHKLEKNILDKLEEFIDDKLNSLEKHIYRKIDALEKIVPDKTDTDVIIHKLDTLKKMQLDLDGSTICTVTNKTRNVEKKILPDIEENIKSKIDALEKKIYDNLKQYTIITLDNVKANKTNSEEKKCCKCDGSEKKISEYIEKFINSKLETMDKKIFNFQQNLFNKLEKIQNKVPELEKSINIKMDALQNLEKNLLVEVYETQYSLGCKLQSVTGNLYVNPFYRMDNDSLKYVKLVDDADGISYFEMHFAVKAAHWAHLLLSPKPSGFDIYHEVSFEIGIHAETIKLRRKKKDIENKPVSKILSPILYTAFYIKINNGTLEFGKEGNSVPLIRHDDALLKTMKYFSFGAWEESGARFFYDCPTDEFLLLFDDN